MSRVAWTDAMLATLRRMNGDGFGLDSIARELGVSKEAIRHKRRELDLPSLVGQGARVSAAMKAQQAKREAGTTMRPCMGRCGRSIRSQGAHHRFCEPCRLRPGETDYAVHGVRVHG